MSNDPVQHHTIGVRAAKELLVRGLIMSGERPRPVARPERVELYAARFPECDAESMRAYLTVRALMTRLDHALETHLARHHLSFGRFLVLVQLLQAEGHTLTPAQLSTYVGVTRATMTGLLATLEKSRFVAREPDPEDGRSVLVRLTVTGRRFVERLLPDHFERITRLMGALTRPELKQLQRLMHKLGDTLGALEDP
jgi:DNA-binding MarR family transcriptional regulator